MNGHEVKEDGGQNGQTVRENKSKVGSRQGKENWLIFRIYYLKFGGGAEVMVRYNDKT